VVGGWLSVVKNRRSSVSATDSLKSGQSNQKRNITYRDIVVALSVQFWNLFVMPHQAGIDAPGALQHIIIRGIERMVIF
jgi:hypothetical protein